MEKLAFFAASLTAIMAAMSQALAHSVFQPSHLDEEDSGDEIKRLPRLGTTRQSIPSKQAWGRCPRQVGLPCVKRLREAAATSGGSVRFDRHFGSRFPYGALCRLCRK